MGGDQMTTPRPCSRPRTMSEATCFGWTAKGAVGMPARHLRMDKAGADDLEGDTRCRGVFRESDRETIEAGLR